MSHLLDFVLTPDNKMDMDLDVDAILPDDMKNIFDNGDLMSSDFFDSVFSMEKQNLDTSVSLPQDLMSDVHSDSSSLQSPLHDTIFSEAPRTEYLIQSDETEDNITLFGKENSETITGGNVMTAIGEKLQHNFSEILGVSGNQQVYVKPTVKINPKQVIITQPANGKKTTVQPAKKTQLLRIQSVQGSGKPLLLPYVKTMKKFRVINASDLKVNSIKVLPPACQTVTRVEYTTSNDSTDGEMDSSPEPPTYSNGKYPPLHLTNEEKRLLMKEGITLPTHYPLSKQDEKELKRIRRKIRNKISAQDSRKRKKEYVDQLEEKARRTDEENEILKKRVKLLNRENTRLYEQLKKLQDILFNTSNKATPTTCLMIVLFSTLLVCLPNLRTADKTDLEIADQESVASRRVLLFDQKVRDEEDMNLEEFLILKKEESEMHLDEDDKENGTSAFVKYLSDLSKKYESLIRSNCSEILQGGSLQEFCKKHESEFKLVLDNLRTFIDKGTKEEKKFIEPDISDDEGEVLFKHRNAYLLDDDDPPTKKIRISRELIDYDDDAPVPIFEVEIQSNTENNNSVPVKE